MEAESAGDNRGGDLQDELAQRGDPRGAQRQVVLAELGSDGAVFGGPAGAAARVALLDGRARRGRYVSWCWR